MSLPNNLGRLSAGLTADASLNIGVGVTPSGTYKFEVGTTSKFTGVATFGSTISNGTYTYTLPSATGTLALTSAIPTNAVGASGFWTSGFLAKINGTYTVTSSIIQDDGGSHVAIGYLTNPALYMLDVNGTGKFVGQLTLGSTITNGTYTYTLPSATGTLALTSALSGYLPLSGGTLTGALGGTSASFSSYIETGGGLKATGNTISSGIGAEVLYAGGNGYFQSFNRTTSAYLPTILDGSTLSIQTGGTPRLTIASTGAATFSGQLIFPSTSKMEGSAAPNFTLASTSAAGSGNGPYQTFKTNSSDFGYIGSEDALMSTTGNKLALLALNGLSFRTGSSYLERLSIASTGAATFSGGGIVNINGTSATNNSLQGYLDLRDGNGNELAIIRGYRGAGGNSGILKIYTGFQATTLALTIDDVQAATFSSSVQAKGPSNDNWVFQGLSSAGITIAGLYQNTGGSGLMALYNSSASQTVQISSNGTSWLNGGNVGIGTSSPGFQLDVLSAGGDQAFAPQTLQVRSTNGTSGQGTGIRLSSVGGSKETVGILSVENTSSTNGDMVFRLYNGGATMNEKMRITSSGNVLIGTTTDNGYKVRIDGGASNSGNSFFANGMVIGAQSNGSDYPSIGYNVKFTSSSTYNYFAADYASFIKFNVGKIETYTAPASSGVMSPTAGPYVALGGTSWTSSSDERLKNINSNINNAINKLMTLRAVNFSWKYDNKNKEYLGLIAQDLQKVYPQVVVENDDDVKTLGVNYTELIPVLVKAIQEQQLQIKELQSQINK